MSGVCGPVSHGQSIVRARPRRLQVGAQVGSDLSVDLLDLDLDLDELGWQRPNLVQTPTKKRGGR